ncbi:amidohydrolase [Microbacterium sp. AGC62]
MRGPSSIGGATGGDSAPASAKLELALTRIDDGVRRDAPALRTLSRSIHADPELAFDEVRSSAAVAAVLRESGFTVHYAVGGLKTAFDAIIGEGPLHLAIFAEYDALPEIGHACGHNIIAAAAAGAGLALAPLVDDLGITLHVIGTPAEESGGGKDVLLRAGVFADLHAAVMIHPGPSNVLAPTSLAIAELTAHFRGRASHSAAAPELGINAADAATVSQVAIGLLRQHLRRDQLVHGIITDGGSVPNIVPDTAALHYLLRAADEASLDTLIEKIAACFHAGAMATGSEVVIDEVPPRYLQLRSDGVLLAAGAAAFTRVGRVDTPSSEPMGSTDMGNVMAIIPGLHPMIAVGNGTSSLHQREFVEAAGGPAGDETVLDGARILADLLTRVSLDEGFRTYLLHAGADRRLRPDTHPSTGAESRV